MGTTHKNKERLRTTFFSDEQFKLLCDVLEKFEVLYPGQKRTEPAALEIFALHSKLLDLQKLNRSQISGHFEWIDSILISAMKKGDWILIDNVNLCSSSVLDRLNPLLEPNGNIILNERGMVDGKTPKVSTYGCLTELCRSYRIPTSGSFLPWILRTAKFLGL